MARKKIMVIDDEYSVCDILSKLLSKEYDVVTSSDPIEALTIIGRSSPDCVILDIKMPKMDGIDVLTKIKEQDPKIEVIMITGYGTLETSMEAMKLGAYDYITKPFDLDYVKNLVKRALEG